MRYFFLQRPVFRLLTPLVLGTIAYLLILLVNNNIMQLKAYFLGVELYFCLGLAVLVQEGTWLVMNPVRKLHWGDELTRALRNRALLAMLLTILTVSVAVWTYYLRGLGYHPAMTELLMFCGVFGFLGGLLITLFVSHQMLTTDNEAALEAEEALKQHINADFNQFKQGINPDLLFESLETLIVLLHSDKDQADDLLDRLASVYRYVLGSRKQELVGIEEELTVLRELLALFRLLPYRKIQWSNAAGKEGFLIPGTFLHIVELILRTSIVMEAHDLPIQLSEREGCYVLEYPALEKLQSRLSNKRLEHLQARYRVYSDQPLLVTEEEGIKRIQVPILAIENA